MQPTDSQLFETPLVDTEGLGRRNRLIVERLELALRTALREDATIDAIKLATVLHALLLDLGRYACAEFVETQRNMIVASLRSGDAPKLS